MFADANITVFDLRKAALDAAVMHHGTESNEEAVIASAVKFEAYLRRGVTSLADVPRKADADPDACTCILCTIRKAFQQEQAKEAASETGADDQTDAKAEQMPATEPEPAESHAG